MSRLTRAGAIVALGSATVLLATTAVAAPVPPPAPGPVDEGGVPLLVEVVDQGALAMTVDTSPVVLTESGSDGGVRQFTGTLPTVTVTDTRALSEEGEAWAVIGDTSDFTSADGSAVISGTYLGWEPRLVSTPPDDDGSVVEGVPVASEADDGTGVVGGYDLLVSTFDSTVAREFGSSWEATADLDLRVPAEEAPPGSYSATLTLSLFEG